MKPNFMPSIQELLDSVRIEQAGDKITKGGSPSFLFDMELEDGHAKSVARDVLYLYDKKIKRHLDVQDVGEIMKDIYAMIGRQIEAQPSDSQELFDLMDTDRDGIFGISKD